MDWIYWRLLIFCSVSTIYVELITCVLPILLKFHRVTLYLLLILWCECQVWEEKKKEKSTKKHKKKKKNKKITKLLPYMCSLLLCCWFMPFYKFEIPPHLLILYFLTFFNIISSFHSGLSLLFLMTFGCLVCLVQCMFGFWWKLEKHHFCFAKICTHNMTYNAETWLVYFF